ncbi:MAG TPA: LysR family transcriptional regulator [Euzebyales bacterium]
MFDVVVSSGSLHAAARRLHLGQPAVSHTTAQLERVLGTALFDRTPGTHLTAAGIELRDHVRPTLAALDAGVHAVRRTARGAGVVHHGLDRPCTTPVERPRRGGAGGARRPGRGARLAVPRRSSMSVGS